MTTAISFGFFFFRVILAGASGIIAVGLAFFGSYPGISPFTPKKSPEIRALADCIT
jgi:hypothetical protein